MTRELRKLSGAQEDGVEIIDRDKTNKQEKRNVELYEVPLPPRAGGVK